MQQEQSEVKKGLNSFYLIFAGILLLGVIGYFVVSGGKKAAPEATPVESVISQVQPSALPESSASATVKEFTVDGSSFEFDPKTITVSKGDTVKITFKDNDGRHDLVIDGYNVRTDVIGPGSTDTVEFIADKVGSFKYFCSVANHKDLGMTGTLVVQ